MNILSILFFEVLINFLVRMTCAGGFSMIAFHLFCISKRQNGCGKPWKCWKSQGINSLGHAVEV